MKGITVGYTRNPIASYGSGVVARRGQYPVVNRALENEMRTTKYLPIIDFDQATGPSGQDNPETEARSRTPSNRFAESLLESYALYGAAFYPPLLHSFHRTLIDDETGFSKYDYSSLHRLGEAANDSGVKNYSRGLPPLVSNVSLPISTDGFPATELEDEGARPGWLKGLAAYVQRLWFYIRREREIARAASFLSGLDDHTLRDIGVHRSQIPHVVRYGREEWGDAQSHPS
jgi:uncharacterized protein YjiS (DUF1127 family)